MYYMYDVPEGAERGTHAHRELCQFFIPLTGSFDVLLDDGFCKEKFHLNQPNWGLYLCPMIWRKLKNFSGGAACLVLASELYKEADYINDYSEFLSLAKKANDDSVS